MYCQKCGTEGIEGGFCQKCGTKLSGIAEQQPQQATYQSPKQQTTTDFSQFSSHYQKAFARIEAGENGGFNWAAFLGGSLWALFKGAWLSALASIVICCGTAGIGVPIFWILYGFRANHIMYNVKVKHKQVIL